MSRSLLPVAVVVGFPLALLAADPKADPVEQELVLQQAMATAERHLAANAPAEAVAVLETRLASADGNRAFLDLLRRAYAADVARLESSPGADPDQLAKARRKLDLLGRPADPAPPSPAPAPAAPAAAPAGPALIRDARALFREGKYAEASAKFAAAKDQAPLTGSEAAVWAYCRIKLAADRVNQPACDASTAAAAERDVTEALRLAPDNAELRQVGEAVLAAARRRKEHPTAAPKAVAVPADWEVIETASFLVRFKGTRDAAEAVAKAAEAGRKATFERWSGPPGGAWAPRCEVVLHPTAACYAAMTGKPAAGTGHATVRLADGKATARRIDLRADDAGVVANALPRELTHVVLADLFPYTPPPRWAEEGMAVLAGSPEEVGRYARTLPRCARNGELFTMAALLEMKDFPAAERVTGFYCESVSLVEFLVKLRSERDFTIFLRDCQRYGTASALKRQYNLDGPQALEQAWKRAALDVARGQAE